MQNEVAEADDQAGRDKLVAALAADTADAHQLQCAHRQPASATDAGMHHDFSSLDEEAASAVR